MPSSDRSVSSPIATTEENFAALTVSNVDTIKGKKPAWNVPSGTAAQTIMGDSGAAWPALAAAPTPPRPSPKATSTSTGSSSSSSSSTDDLINSLHGLSVSVPAAPKRVTSLPEKVMVPAPQQPRPNLTRRSSTGSENTQNPVLNNNNRSPRFGNGSNRRGNNNNFHHHHHNNSRGGYRGRGRGGANWNSFNNSPRPPHLFWGNQVMARAPPPLPVSYSYDASAYMSPFVSPMGYGYFNSQLEDPYRAMFGNVQMGAMQSLQQTFPPAYPPFGGLGRRNSILKQIEFYFSEDNLCKDTWLREKMDAHGWVHISVIATFNKVKQLTNDLQVVLEAVSDSAVVEVQGNHIRRRDNWLKWLLPVPRFDPGP